MNKLQPKVLHNRFVEIEAPTEGINGKPGRYRDLKMAIEFRVWQKREAERKGIKAALAAIHAAQEDDVVEGAIL